MILFKELILILLVKNLVVNANGDQNTTQEACLCLNGGSCEYESTCSCVDGFYGNLCQYNLCSDLDQQCNNGTCLMDTRNNNKACRCEPGFKGANCQESICNNYCYNNAECSYNQSDFSNYLNINYSIEINCNCKSERFYGNRCEFDKCFGQEKKCPEHSFLGPDCQCLTDDDCDRNFCHNNGLCRHMDNNLICSCQEPYTGERCEIDKCDNFCLNNGTCQFDNQTNKLFCNCSHGYNGTKCEQKINFFSTSRSRSSLKFIIYAITITFLVCLIVVGCYYSMDKAHLNNFSQIDRIRRTTFSPRSRYQKDFGFSKLEDEQIIIQNEQFINA